MSHPILTIWKKELTDTVRDRRTLASTIILPLVLMPALFIGISKFSTWQIEQMSGKEITVGISEQARPLGEQLAAADSKIKFQSTTEDLKDAIRAKKFNVALSVPSDWQQRVSSAEPVQVGLVANSTNQQSAAAVTRLTAAIGQYNQSSAVTRLTESGVTPAILTTLVPKNEDVATSQEQAGFGMGFILPLFIIMWAVTGGQTTAIDASAGERERKTIEALLLTPVSRFTLVAV